MKIRMATLIGAIVLQAAASAESADYEFFKTKVQPIFLKHRDTHGRCVTCHSGGSTALVLQPLADGSGTWTDEQTKLNYEAVSRIVSPGKPAASQLLMHPLAPEAGGDMFHSGGHQFASQQDPDWQVLAAWVRQMPPPQYKNLKVIKSTENLMETMRVFNLALRSDCTLCHAAPDYASDRRPMKAMARRMIELTAGLNASFGEGKVNCYTCHRGDRTPQNTHPRFPDLKPSF
jgi:hypothetical protein